MPSRILAAITIFVSTAQTGILLAHPGHGATDPQTVSHYAIEPLHALPWIAAIALGLTMTLAWQRRRSLSIAKATTTRRP